MISTEETTKAASGTESKATKKGKTGARSAHVATKKGKATKKAAPAKKAPKAKDAATGAKPAAREGSRKAELLALLQRTDGATLEELMTTSGWQAHSVRGFLSGTVGKKMGLKVDSAKREDGTRVYSMAK
jgi:uncharacterized protein DUF3489